MNICSVTLEMFYAQTGMKKYIVAIRNFCEHA